MTSGYEVRLFDFNIYDEECDTATGGDSTSDGSDSGPQCKDSKQFKVQAFGIDEKGNSYSLTVEDVEPFFFAKVNEKWKDSDIPAFKQWLIEKVGNYYRGSIDVDVKLQHHHKLYGFDAGKTHRFLKITCASLMGFNKVKKLWYDIKTGRTYIKKLKRKGLEYPGSPGLRNEKFIEIYEGNIPPLLRYFHIHDISPSGWVKVNSKPKKQCLQTNCKFEFNVLKHEVVALNDKETIVPFKICSFDIEASSSHGDFPIPIKSYKKLANEIIDFAVKKEINTDLFKEILENAFGYTHHLDLYISLVYPKKNISYDALCKRISNMLAIQTADLTNNSQNTNITIESLFEKCHLSDDEDDGAFHNNYSKKPTKHKNLIDNINDSTVGKQERLLTLNSILSQYLPELQGDIVTFIGSTFVSYGESAPHLNHCLVLNGCSKIMNAENTVIETCKTEKELLIKWAALMKSEDPDMMIGYNIFGFDYEFMFRRAIETNCVEEFLQLSRNKNEICGTKDKTAGYKIQETSIVLASGPHDLNYINMPGRIQIDLYNYFRRDYNLASYKLDAVAGNFIGDDVTSFEHTNDNKTIVHTRNLSGVTKSSYIHFEEINHTNEYINNGDKYIVLEVDKTKSQLVVDTRVQNMSNKKIRWCLAKDDVTPQDIFRLTNGSDDDRSIVAKYCIQDCNLVHSLLKKIDVITGFIEMSKLCSVPISFLVLRGQGIKLTSFISKKCREKNTLMPVLKNFTHDDEGYEGAIVLEPKCNIYLDNPVACVDYSSLYPSSMISENICHSSKVWTKEYNLTGELIKQTGVVDSSGEFLYDNLPNYTYVDVEYDTFTYVRKTPKAAPPKNQMWIQNLPICRIRNVQSDFAFCPRRTPAIS